MALTPAVLAADIHKRMVDDERFGYSWEERYGATPETWTVDGRRIEIKVGDYDCSSSTITAWRLALGAFGLGDVLAGATYTGNIRSVFARSGLFEVRTDFANSQRGDLYLNDGSHVAMCQGGGRLSEFSWGDNGAYGNRRGDQSGRESGVNPWYWYPWDCYLHYIGTIGDDDEVTEQDKRDIARMTADEILNRTLAVDGEQKNIPFWQLVSWCYRYTKGLFGRK